MLISQLAAGAAVLALCRGAPTTSSAPNNSPDPPSVIRRDQSAMPIALSSRPRHDGDSWNPDLRLLRAHLDTRSKYSALLDEGGRQLLKRDWDDYAALHRNELQRRSRRDVQPGAPVDGIPTVLRNWKADRIYSLPVAIGTPGQGFAVTIDTGSAALWVYGAECNTSLCADSLGYQNTQSSTASAPEGKMDITYGQGATEGHWIRDTVSLGGWAITDFEFGVAHSVVDQPWDGTDTKGILGLSWGMNGWAAPFWQTLAVQAAFKDPRFGLYLARERDTRESTVQGQPVREDPGGSLTLGGVDSEVIAGNVNYLDVVKTHGRVTFWRVPIAGYTVNGQFESVSVDGIIDSGTSFIYLPPNDHKRFWALVPGATHMPLEEYGDNWDRYYAFPCQNESAIQALNLSFSFGGNAYQIEPTDLIYQPIQQGSLDGYCIGAVLDGSGIVDNFDGAWLLGDAFLKNVYSVYTYDPPQVGFANLKEEYNLKLPGMDWVNETSQGATLSPPPVGINQQTPTAVVTVPAAKTDADPEKNRIFNSAPRRLSAAAGGVWAAALVISVCSSILPIF